MERVITPIACDCGKCPPDAEFIESWHLSQYIFADPDPDELTRDWHRHLAREAEDREAARQRWETLCAEVLPARAIAIARAADETPAIQKLLAWHDEGSRTIAILSGPPGTGKTVAACYVALHRWKHRPRFVTASAYARMSKFGDERTDVLEASRVILDDLGAEYADKGGSWLADFDELIDTWYQQNTIAVVTTNLTAAQFKARYGVRVVDRLAECGTWIPIVGESLRRTS